MRLSLLCALLLVGLCACAPGPPVFDPVPEPTSALRPPADRGPVPEDARITDYVLDAHLDAEQHRVTGSARVTWRNRTSQTVTTLPFHLYMNGFRAETTAWMRSSRGNHRVSRLGGSDKDRDDIWGYIDVHSVELVGAEVDRSETETQFIEDAIEKPVPADAVPLSFREDEDPSTMTVDLPRPVGPGETIIVDLDFTTQLPHVLARTGFHDDFHAVAQWFPKLGVLEETGWEAHTFTVHDEFYASFGHYTVNLDVPEDAIVGATGIRTGEEIVNGRKHLTYEAEMVHDFVWMSDPDFVEHLGEHEGIRIRQLFQPGKIDDAEAHLAATVASLDSYQARYGQYPWSTVTIIHVPQGGRGAGGMEYPTLFTTSDRAPIPEWVRRSFYDERTSGIFTTIHEFGHQYFQGLFAIREHREPWLDEGMNTYSNIMAMRDWFGSDNPWMMRVLSQEIGGRDGMRIPLRFRSFLEPVAQEASDFDALIGNFGSTTYMRTAAIFLTLRNIVGHDDFDRALRVFSDRARFRHPTGEDLITTLVDELGGRVDLGSGVELDVAEYLDQALNTTRIIDFKIVSTRNYRLAGDTGWHRDASGELVGGEAPANLDKDPTELPDEGVEGVLVVHRQGAFVVPVTILAKFADGSEERVVWDGRETTATYRWPGRRLVRASLDPDELFELEFSRLDNHAFARDAEEGDGLSQPVGHLIEGVHLAMWGALGP